MTITKQDLIEYFSSAALIEEMTGRSATLDIPDEEYDLFEGFLLQCAPDFADEVSIMSEIVQKFEALKAKILGAYQAHKEANR